MKIRDIVGAERLGVEGWEPPPTPDHPLPSVTCPCGWRGSIADMLVVGDAEPIYCPRCHRNGWEGWTYD